MNTETINPIKLLSANDVSKTIGMSKSWIYQQIRQGKFPEPLRVGPQKTAWKMADIAQWVNSLPQGVEH